MTAYAHLKAGDMFFSHHRWWEVAEVRKPCPGLVEVRAVGSRRFVPHHCSTKVRAQSYYPAGSGFGQYVR